MPKKECFFIQSEGPSSDSVKKALKWLIKYPSEKGFIAVMGHAILKGVISDVLGESAIKTLIKKGRLFLSEKEILLVTERKPVDVGGGLPMVVFFPTSQFLDKMDSIPNLSAMLVVPWRMKEIELWIKARNATELGKQKPHREPLIRNKVVEQALKDLTLLVNVSTGIAHPSDRNRAIQTFEILRNAGEEFTPEEIKAWLIAKGGWKAVHAQEVAELAQKVLQGKKLRKGPPVWRKDILKIWRKKAKETCKNKNMDSD